MEVLDLLNKLEIKYTEIEHEAVFTCEQAEFVKNLIDGQGCKNLFLRNNKKQYFMYILPDEKKADLKGIGKNNDLGHLSFGNEEKLWDLLKLKPGSVSPFGIINDNDNQVTLLIDSKLKDKLLIFHPNDNTKSLNIEFSDLIRVIEYTKHKYLLI